MFSIVYHISFCPLVVNVILIPQGEMKGIWQQSQTCISSISNFHQLHFYRHPLSFSGPAKFLNITSPIHVTCYRLRIWGLTDQLENCRGDAFVVSLLWN